MGKWSRCDYRQLQKLRDNLAKLQSADMDKFCRDMSKKSAAMLLGLVIPATPVGDYKRDVEVTAKRDSKYHKKGDVYTKRVNDTGKIGGTLRRGWTAKTHHEAVAGQGSPTAAESAAHAEKLLVSKSGATYTVEIINPVQYASYVEFGHRQEVGRYVPALGKRLVQGWVPGQYFLTRSEQDLKRILPGVIQKNLDALLREAFKV